MTIVDSEQRAFLTTSSRFINNEYPLKAVRLSAETETEVDDSYHAKTAELGWFALSVAEEHGGGSLSGNNILDLAMLAEVRGSVLQPDSFVETNVVADSLSKYAEPRTREALLDPIIEGRSRVTWSFPCDVRAGTSVVLAAGEGPHQVSGNLEMVLDAHRCDYVMVNARIEGEPVAVMVPLDAAGVETTPLAGVDVTRRFSRVTLRSVPVDGTFVIARGVQ